MHMLAYCLIGDYWWVSVLRPRLLKIQVRSKAEIKQPFPLSSYPKITKKQILFAQFKEKQYLCPRNRVIGLCSFLFAPAFRRTNSIHIDKSVCWRFEFGVRKNFATFSVFKVKIKVSNRCLPVWRLPHRVCICRCVITPYPRRLPVVYLTLKAMRRPQLVSNQPGGLRFLYIYLPCKQYQQINIVY